MGIEDIQISEELQTNAPSIKYSGNEGPKSPQQMQEMMMAQLEEEYLKYVDDMMEQGMEPMTLEQFLDQAMAEGQMSGGQPLPSDPTKPVNPFQPKPTGPVLPDRQMAAYGGIMGLDGRKQYGFGSWFQENIMDNYKKFTGQTQQQIDEDSQDRVDRESENYENPIDTFLKGKPKDPNDPDSERKGGQAKNILPALGGIVAGLFTKKDEDGNTVSASPDETALQLADLKKTANVLDQKQGLAANLNFLPAISARKYSPQEMVEVYQNAANGGRIGYENGGDPLSEFEVYRLGQMGYDVASKGVEPFGGLNVLRDILKVNSFANGGRIGFNMGGGIMDNRMGYNNGGSVITLMDGTTVQIPDGAYDNGTFKDIIYSSSKGDLLREEIVRKLSFANGGRIGFEEGGGIMDLGGMEKDYRAEGGFVPIGKAEKADDVPARLSVNEFVFTADAVRNAGGGDIDQGAQVMENMMRHLEQGGQVSEESQGMQGARDMFATSQRLGEVI